MRKSMNVVVTGVSSGIGLSTAKTLLDRGDKVFGTVRREVDAAQLRAAYGAQFQPLVLDLTQADTIERGVAQLDEQLAGAPLHALINNAGVALPGPVAEQPMQQLRAMFEVNFFGLLVLTRACLPLLGVRSARADAPGKIINVSSGAGKIGIPFLAGYVASKHALEGFSQSLRRELLPWGISVVVVGPGNVKTPIWNKAGDEQAYAGGLFGPVYANFLRMMREGEQKGMAPEEIAELLAQIVDSKKPKTRYEPVAQKFANWTLPRLLPDRAMDKMLFKMLGMQPVLPLAKLP
jgi:NAD(P)-dependent dehydrogenase (short-subunit alcohol dehydrogenase family)